MVRVQISEWNLDCDLNSFNFFCKFQYNKYNAIIKYLKIDNKLFNKVAIKMPLKR